MQRQALRAIHRHWQEGADAENPQSSAYPGTMVDPERLYVWCWDARPFPSFPERDDIWADAPNYEIGHWLNGRLGVASSSELIAALARDYGVEPAGVDAVPPAVVGMSVGTVTSLREAAAPVLAATGLLVRDTPQGLDYFLPRGTGGVSVEGGTLVAGEGAALTRRRGEPAMRVGHLSLSCLDRGRDYQAAAVIALAPEGDVAGAENLPLVLEPADARRAARTRLLERTRAMDRVELVLGPETLALEPGDLIAVEGVAEAPFLVEEIRDGAGRAVTASAWSDGVAEALPSPRRRGPKRVPGLYAPPYLLAAHLPRPEGPGSHLVLAARADPWPGRVAVRDPAQDADLSTLTRSAVVGALTTPLEAGTSAVWTAGPCEIELASGHLAPRDPEAVLAGANRLALRSDTGEWEVIGFSGAELVGPKRYRLLPLLRGQRGTVPAPAAAGQPLFVLDGRTEALEIPLELLGSDWTLVAFGGPRDGVGSSVAVPLATPAATPLAPVHMRVRRLSDGDLALEWIRRTRLGGDAWGYGEVPLDESLERYRVEVRDGEQTVRVLETQTPGLLYSLDQQQADWGGVAALALFSVQQVSPRTGPGARAWATGPAA